MIRKIALVLIIGFFTYLEAWIPDETVICEYYFVDKLGDSNVKWLFYGDPDTGGEGIIPQIEQVGHNSKYIIVEAGLSEYYIIPYTANTLSYFDKKILIGPLSEEQFEQQKSKLSMEEELDFTHSF